MKQQKPSSTGQIPGVIPGERNRRKVTIYDLAEHTGFSPGTVSRVLNNKDRVKPATRTAILEAARELDLKPQVSARNRQVALLTEPTFTDRIEGYAATLTAHLAFALSRKNIGVSLPSNPLEQLSGMFLDGIIAVTFDHGLQEYLASMEEPMPIVYMDEFGQTENHYRICSDHFRAGYLAAEHLLQCGKKRIGFFGGEGSAFEERLKGFKTAIIDAGRTPDENLMVMALKSEHQSVVTRLVRRGVEGIYVPGTSFQAVECLHLLTYVMGLKVPEDVAIIGGENEGISQYQYPPLTTIGEPLKEMAEAAVEVIDRLTSGRTVEHRERVLPVRLIERNSVT